MVHRSLPGWPCGRKTAVRLFDSAPAIRVSDGPARVKAMDPLAVDTGGDKAAKGIQLCVCRGSRLAAIPA